MTRRSTTRSPARAGTPRRSSRVSDTTIRRGETPRARGERTRGRVADALIGLLDEGDPTPTAKSVADRAQVSVRLVFHHFEDMETLYKSALEVERDRHYATLPEVDPTLGLAERIERTVTHRGRLFERVGPVRRASVALSLRREDIAATLATSDAFLRSSLQTTFGPELDRAGKQRRELLEALDAAASWEAWDRLRRVQRLPAAAARRAFNRTLGGLLAN